MPLDSLQIGCARIRHAAVDQQTALNFPEPEEISIEICRLLWTEMNPVWGWMFRVLCSCAYESAYENPSLRLERLALNAPNALSAPTLRAPWALERTWSVQKKISERPYSLQALCVCCRPCMVFVARERTVWNSVALLRWAFDQSGSTFIEVIVQKIVTTKSLNLFEGDARVLGSIYF